MKPILCVVGPTASGKTALSIELAKRLNGEVISCDSMQIYDKMNIGTAKPSIEEQSGIPHHLIGFADPRLTFSCADYVPLADKAITEVQSRGHLPILCGGTGLYLDSVLNATSCLSFETGHSSIRDELYAEYERNGIDRIYERLTEVDPVSAKVIHKNNAKRVIRALEIFINTGKPKSLWDIESKALPPRYPSLILGIDYHDRSILHDRINHRVDLMLEQGLFEEAKELYQGGWLPKNSTASQAIGYKEFLSALRGECTVAEATERLRCATRQYAKRQLTWFRRNPSVHWIYPDDCAKSGTTLIDAAMPFCSCFTEE